MSTEEIQQPVLEDLAAVRRLLEEEIKRPEGVLSDVLAYILTTQGKQLRMQLVLMAAAICHGVTDKTRRTALAFEFLHTASLVHDDVVDNSPLRRGKESVHQHWSNKVAVLAGDYMLSRVIEIVADLRNVRIWQILACLGKELADGEVKQLHVERSMWISEEDYYRIISGKTASLFAACMEAGAESSAGSPKQVRSLRTFGWNLGMCFQLKDDVLDYSDSEQLDKPTMNDLRSGNVTLPLLVSLMRAPQEEADAIRLLAEQPLDRVGEETIRNFIMRYEGIPYAYRRMAIYKEQALEALNSAFHDSPVRRSLTALLDYAIHRVK